MLIEVSDYVTVQLSGKTQIEIVCNDGFCTVLVQDNSDVIYTYSGDEAGCYDLYTAIIEALANGEKLFSVPDWMELSESNLYI